MTNRRRVVGLLFRISLSAIWWAGVETGLSLILLSLVYLVYAIIPCSLSQNFISTDSSKIFLPLYGSAYFSNRVQRENSDVYILLVEV
jgi:hypothetical protein